MENDDPDKDGSSLKEDDNLFVPKNDDSKNR